MNYRHDEIDDDRHDDHARPRERELTLGTTTILGIFFALALLCGAFFAFGFNMGSKARTTAAATTDSPTATANFNAFKPSPGAPAIQPVPGYMSQKVADDSNHSAANTAYNTPGQAAAFTVGHPAASTPTPAAPIVRETPEEAAAPTPHVGPAVHLAPTPAEPTPAGSFLVQVAAVSHQEDAELLVGALKRKGYAVQSHTEPQDKLFHIQVGPFSNKKDAEAMRQRLLSDGYNAIVK